MDKHRNMILDKIHTVICSTMLKFQLLLLCVFLSVWRVDSEQCPAGFTSFETSCYKYSSSTASFAGAKSACQNMGAYLAEVDSAAENAFLIDLKGSGGGERSWIGLNDKNKEGTFRWSSSGTIATFTNWAPTEPNNRRNEDCVQIYYNGLWNDQECGDVINYYCERDPTCPKGMSYYGGRCYYDDDGCFPFC